MKFRARFKALWSWADRVVRTALCIFVLWRVSGEVGPYTTMAIGMLAALTVMNFWSTENARDNIAGLFANQLAAEMRRAARLGKEIKIVVEKTRGFWR